VKSAVSPWSLKAEGLDPFLPVQDILTVKTHETWDPKIRMIRIWGPRISNAKSVVPLWSSRGVEPVSGFWRVRIILSVHILNPSVLISHVPMRAVRGWWWKRHPGKAGSFSHVISTLNAVLPCGMNLSMMSVLIAVPMCWA